MRLQGIKETRAGGLYQLRGAADGITVEDRLCGKTYFVEVRNGRWVGPCSCGSPAGVPFEGCRHQTLVRDLLLERWFKPVVRKRGHQ